MAYFTLELQDSVYVLTMINGDKGNVMDDAWLDELTVHLDAIEADPAANRALVLASNHEKAWSNGIDLDYIRSKGMAYLFDHFVPRLDGFLGRIAWLNLPTVACISGNAYGGGALIASACDFRTMRADRGRICFPEIDLKLGLSPAMVECVNTLPNEQARWEMVMTGRALGGVFNLPGLVMVLHGGDGNGWGQMCHFRRSYAASCCGHSSDSAMHHMVKAIRVSSTRQARGVASKGRSRRAP